MKNPPVTTGGFLFACGIPISGDTPAMDRTFSRTSAALFAALAPTVVFAAPKFSPDADFPTAKQSLNACYFYSTDIALRAKY